MHVLQLNSHSFNWNEGFWEIRLNLRTLLILLLSFLLRLLFFLLLRFLSRRCIWNFLSSWILFMFILIILIFFVGLFFFLLCWLNFFLFNDFSFKFFHWNFVENELQLRSKVGIIMKNISTIDAIILEQSPSDYSVKYFHCFIKQRTLLVVFQVRHNVLPFFIEILQKLSLRMLFRIFQYLGKA